MFLIKVEDYGKEYIIERSRSVGFYIHYTGIAGVLSFVRVISLTDRFCSVYSYNKRSHFHSTGELSEINLVCVCTSHYTRVYACF